MKKILVFVASVLIFAGCGSKSIYKPEKTDGSVSFDGSLPSKISSVTASGATLANGQILTKENGLNAKVMLPPNYQFLDDSNGYITAGLYDGNILVLDSKTGDVILKQKLNNQVASASYKNGKLAVILADNTAALYEGNKTLFSKKNIDPLGLNTKIASPLFLGDLVIFPTLDGKLQILDQSQMSVVKDLVISDEKHFNNIMFVHIVDDRLIAATTHKVMSINPKFMNTYNAEISDVIFTGKTVYIFTGDGKVVQTDADLRVIKEQKFKFARFAGSLDANDVYAVERQGYLIELNKDLSNSKVLKFNTSFTGMWSDALNELLFTSKDTVFYGDRYYKISK